MPFNVTFPTPKQAPIELTKFFVQATHRSLNFTDSFGLGDPTFSALHLLKFLDSFAMGDTRSSATPVVDLASRVAASRVTVRNSAFRGPVRVQALHSKEQEFDNKTRQANPRIPE